jgi:pheromone shutdown protein TraB
MPDEKKVRRRDCGFGHSRTAGKQMPERDEANLISGAHVRIYASTDLRHAILEVSAGPPPAITVRLDEKTARSLIGQLQSAVDMIRSVHHGSRSVHAACRAGGEQLRAEME